MQISRLNAPSQNYRQNQKRSNSQPAFGRAEFIIGMAKELKVPFFKKFRTNRILSMVKKAFFDNPELSKAIEDSSFKNTVEVRVFPKKKPWERRAFNAIIDNNIYGARTFMIGNRFEKGEPFNQRFVANVKKELGKDEKYLKLINEKYENEFPFGPRVR